MNAALGIIILAVIGYAGSLYVFSKERLPPLVRHLFYSGWEFILVGMVIGPFGTGFFPAELLREMTPVIDLGTGWVGLLVGTQMRLADIRRVERWQLKLTFHQAAFSAMAVGAAIFVPLRLFFGWGAPESGVAAAVVAAAAAVSSPTVLTLLTREHGYGDRVKRLLQVISNLDATVGIFLFMLVFTLFRPDIASARQGGFYLLQCVCTGALLGFLFRYLPRERLSEKELLVVMAGFVFFSSGVGHTLGVSALAVNFIAGAVLANTLRPDDPSFEALFRSERPFYIVMLLTAGLMFVPSGHGALVAALAASVRLLAKERSIGWLMGRMAAGFPFPSGGGKALASQGGMALVIGFSLLSVDGGASARTVFSIIVLSVVLSEIAAPFAARRVLERGR